MRHLHVKRHVRHMAGHFSKDRSKADALKCNNLLLLDLAQAADVGKSVVTHTGWDG